MRIVALLMLPAAVVFVAALAAGHLVGTPQPVTTQHASAIVWADRVFTTRGELARWLRSRGASYERWAAQHPPAPAQAPAPPAAHWWDRPALRTAAAAIGIIALVLVLLVALLRRRPRIRLPRVSLPRRPAASPGGLRFTMQPSLRGVERTSHYVLHRRSGTAWVVASSCLGLAVALLLPHL